MSERTKCVLERCIKTFVETAVAYALPAIAGVEFFGNNNLKTVLVGIGISATATGISAVWNGMLKPLLDKNKSGTVCSETPSDDFITEDENKADSSAKIEGNG